MITFKIINKNNINKLTKKELNQIIYFLNIENKFYDLHKLKKSDFKNRLINKYSYIFIFENEQILGGFRYFKKIIKDRILLNRFIYKNGTYYVIQSAFILPKFRGKGFCSKLLQYFFEKISPQKTVIAVDSKNKIAIKCYLKNGFKKIVERKIINKSLDSNKINIDKEFLLIKKI